MNTCEHEVGGQDLKNVQEVSKKSVQEKFQASGKNHLAYWRPRVFHQAYTVDGQSRLTPDYAIKLQFLGRRETFPLGTANQEVAAAKAKAIYQSLVGSGWEATMAKYKPTSELPNPSKAVTVGEYLEAVKVHSGILLATFATYARKFRTVVAGVFNLHGGPEKFDYVNGGHQQWLARINRIRISKLTKDRIEKWKIRFLKEAEATSPVQLKHAQVSVNSMIRSGKALFTNDVMERLPGLAVLSPFNEVKNVPIKRARYKSEIDPRVLMMAARNELPESQPEAFKIFLLALCAGLRRDEIDTLTWNQIDFTRNTIRIETNEHTHAKSEDSENVVDCDPAMLKTLRQFMRGSGSQFVIKSKVAPRPNAYNYSHYRCDRHFQSLIRWLRSKGITAKSPLHTLRKEFGSMIAKQAGIFAASLALRHSDIQLTRDYYLDKKQPVFLSLASLENPDQSQDNATTSKTA